MAMINLTVALTSPMFTDTFSVNRRTQTVGTNGRASISSQVTPAVYGVVYPSDDNELRLLGDMQVTGKTITVITQFALRSESEVSGAEFMPDVVTWKGDNFLVKHIEDWSSFGPGFILAICTSTDIVDNAPVTNA